MFGAGFDRFLSFLLRVPTGALEGGASHVTPEPESRVAIRQRGFFVGNRFQAHVLAMVTGSQ